MTLNGAIATNRFGLGARPGEIAAASGDPRAWLIDQLDVNTLPYIPDLPSTRSITMGINRRREAIQDLPDDEKPPLRKEGRRIKNAIFRDEVEARMRFGASTRKPFHERLTRFWSNHFTVSAKQRDLVGIAGAYEREAIRPNVLGRFVDLAFAAIGHPAMLVYLDNVRSVGPNSGRGRRGDAGLNENLAREVLELHTVSPESGYTQTDIEELARALTGWTVARPRHGPEFEGQTIFVDRLHEPGTRSVMGRSYPQSGGDQAAAILDDLCAHPSTARAVSEKLAAHFVSDTPPEALVQALTDAFIQTNGDLSAMYTVLIDAPEAWSAEPMKVKTPDELLTSTARLIGPERTFIGRVRDVTTSFAQQTFQASSPEGWPDDGPSWLGPDSVLKRIEWANRLAEQSPGIDARQLLQTGLGERLTDRTLRAVQGAESGEQAIVLALMSPDFQRR